jgi:nitrate reductase NapE component
MTTPEIPKHSRGTLEFMKWFVLAVTLSPMLCCAGCLGYGFLVARFQQPAGPRPTPPQLSSERQ